MTNGVSLLPYRRNRCSIFERPRPRALRRSSVASVTPIPVSTTETSTSPSTDRTEMRIDLRSKRTKFGLRGQLPHFLFANVPSISLFNRSYSVNTPRNEEGRMFEHGDVVGKETSTTGQASDGQRIVWVLGRGNRNV